MRRSVCTCVSMPLTGECGTLSRLVPTQQRAGDDLTRDASKSDTAESEWRTSGMDKKNELLLHFKKSKEVIRKIILLHLL